MLIDAAKENNLAVLEILSQQRNFDPNISDPSGKTALMWAAFYGHRDFVIALIEKGANLHLKDNDQSNAVHFVAKKGNAELIELLINEGIDISTPDEKGFTPLHHTVNLGHNLASVALLKLGASPNTVEINQLTPLHIAVIRQNENDIDLLLKYYADINARDNVGRTALCYAATSGNEKIIKKLILSGAQVNITCHTGWTPLHYATYQNNESAIQLLIKNGSVVDARDKLGITPMHMASDDNFENCILCLEKAGSQINPKQYQLRRIVSLIFNEEKLNNLLSQNDGFAYHTIGGFSHQAKIIFEKALNFSLKTDNKYKNIIESILVILTNFATNQFNDEISESKKLEYNLLETGCQGHILYALAKQTSEKCKIKLIFNERGLFGAIDSKTNKIKSIFYMDISIETFAEARKRLELAKNSTPEIAYKILFEEIPSLTCSKYIYLPVLQKAIKGNHCFYDNFSTVMLSLFIEKLGILEGHKEYKKFSLFLLEIVERIYREQSTDINKNEVLKILDSQIEAKKGKILTNLGKEQSFIGPDTDTSYQFF